MNPIEMTTVERKLLDRILQDYEITEARLMSKARPASVSGPRQIWMSILAWNSSRSLVEIGTMTGGRDHGTVIHARKKVMVQMELDPETRAYVEKLEEKFYGESPTDQQRQNRPGYHNGFSIRIPKAKGGSDD